MKVLELINKSEMYNTYLMKRTSDYSFRVIVRTTYKLQEEIEYNTENPIQDAKIVWLCTEAEIFYFGEKKDADISEEAKQTYIDYLAGEYTIEEAKKIGLEQI